MIEQWQELKETIIELRDNDGTQQEVCKFLANLMDVLEKQMSDSENPTGDLISRQAVLDAIEDDTRLGMYSRFASNNDAQCFKQAVNEIPPVSDSENPKKCETWRHYEGMLYCPKCGAEFYDEIMEYTGDKVPKHCPDCGADMREPIGEKIRCNTCVNNDDELSGECYECLKGIFDHYEKKNGGRKWTNE